MTWRMTVKRPRHEEGDLRFSDSYGVVAEIAVDGWLHVEEVGTGIYRIQIAGTWIHVRLDDDRKVRAVTVTLEDPDDRIAYRCRGFT